MNTSVADGGLARRGATPPSWVSPPDDAIRSVLHSLFALARAEIREAVREALSDQSTPEDTSRLTAHELAEKLKVHPETIYRWSKKPGFPRKPVGVSGVRFDLDEVLAWRHGKPIGE